MYNFFFEHLSKLNLYLNNIIYNQNVFDLTFTVILVASLIVSIIAPLVLTIAFFTLMERKIIGAMQLRLGPNFLGLGGILQPLADGVKLLLKETILPTHAQKNLFLFAPFLLFLLSLTLWLVIPSTQFFVISDLYLGLYFCLSISSLQVYSIILAGWSSNSNYSLLGALRSAAQMISYEVSIGIILISIFINVGSFNLIEVILAQKNCWFIFLNFPAFIMFFISALAETNRAPFDLPEAEAELVSGYNVEYSGMSFALFFLAEYANIIFMSFLTTIFFLGGELSFFNFIIFPLIEPQIYYTFKVFLIMFLFVWVRVTLPRLRYDQLMIMGWKYILPLSLGILIITTGFLTYIDAF